MLDAVAAPAPGAVLPSGLMMAGAGLLAAATVAGARLARRRPGQQQIWLGAAAGALLVIAALHVLPDAWSQARAAGIWPRAVPLAAAGAFLGSRRRAAGGRGHREPAPVTAGGRLVSCARPGEARPSSPRQ